MEPSTSEPVEFSVPLPRSTDTRIYIRLTTQSKAIVALLTTASAEERGTLSPMGSFVYALPDVSDFPPRFSLSPARPARRLTYSQRFNPDRPLSTPLYVVEPTLEFATRVARLLAKKTQVPVYVGNSISLVNTGLGGSMEEEMEAFGKVVDVVSARLQHLIK